MLKPYCHPVSRLAILTFCVSVSPGCAIDNFGLVNVHHYENKTIDMVSKESW